MLTCYVSSLIALQKLDGEPATGICQREFEAVMRRTRHTCQELQRQNPRCFPGGVKFVMDNARFHASELRLLEDRAITIPPRSPEFNKPIEHLFNTIKSKFKKRYSARSAVLATQGDYIRIAEAKKLLDEVVHDVVDPESILKDAKSMKGTFQAIIEHQGGRIPKKLS
jgi:hypothetical protein